MTAQSHRSFPMSRIVHADELVDEAVKVATKIAGFSRPAVLMTKEAVDVVFETPRAEGLRFARRLFHPAFGTEDKAEGMSVFLEKRSPTFKNR